MGRDSRESTREILSVLNGDGRLVIAGELLILRHHLQISSCVGLTLGGVGLGSSSFLFLPSLGLVGRQEKD